MVPDAPLVMAMAVTVMASPSASLSLVRTPAAATERVASSLTAPVSSTAVGASLPGLAIVMLVVIWLSRSAALQSLLE